MLEVTHIAKTNTLHMHGPESLGADDLRVLQGVVAFAGIQRVELPAEPTTETGRRLRQALRAEGPAVALSTLALTVSWPDFLTAIGYSDTGKRVRSIAQASLERLSQVTLTVEGKGPGIYKGRLLAYIGATEAGYISTALSPYLAGPIIGHTGQQFVHIDLTETRRLKSAAARLIHHRLCGWIDRGDCRKATLGTLQSYLWPDALATGSTHRTRQQATRAAIDEIIGCGWGMNLYGVGKYEITRPRAEAMRQVQKPRRSPTKRQANADRQSA